MSQPIQTLIADGNGMLREGLRMYLCSDEDIEIVGEATDGAEAIRMCQQIRPDVLLLDLYLPDMDGLDVVREIRKTAPNVNIIVLTGSAERYLVQSALQVGVTSYMLKNVTAQEICMTIRWAKNGRSRFSPEVVEIVADVLRREPVSSPELTDRQQQVIELLVQGKTNAQIALELDVSIPTVKKHVSGILDKLEAASRTEAVAIALQFGIISRDAMNL